MKLIFYRFTLTLLLNGNYVVNFSRLTIKQKITALLIAYFFVAFTAIASTLFVSWRLEGGAAAINDAGSERMRSYQIGFLLAQHIKNPSEALIADINQAILVFENTLAALEMGDPSRPLLLPKDPNILSLLQQIQQTWHEQNKKLVLDILHESNGDVANQLLLNYSHDLKALVASIDRLVVMVEQSQAQATNLLRSFQITLVSLALVGTLLLIYLFMRMVIRPVKKLQTGLIQMSKRDFGIRLPITSYDELGDLALGFNRMAEQLQESYATLEERVKNKTLNLEMKRQELTALYDTASFLNTSSETGILCDGVLDKMISLFGAQAGVVRLVDHKAEGIPIVASYGLSEDFISKENQLTCGECLCGETAKSAVAVSYNVSQIDDLLISKHTCKSEGFEGVVSVPIKTRKGVIGVFNLFFQQACILPPSEVKLLETVSQHLGAAIESQRFVEREKEMAISEERNLLAQELHDSIAQSLAFLNIQSQLLQDGLRKGLTAQVDSTLSQIKEGIQESYDDVRELLVHFRTRIEHDDIDVAVRDALKKFEDQTGIKTHYQFEGNALTLQPETILQFLHILHECLSNIRKHSQATQVDVHLSHDTECQLIIHDNGVGFDHNQDAGDTHVGLRIMKERTQRIDGKLIIDSTPDNGTTICLTLPLGMNILNTCETNT